ncbi:Dynamin family protein [Roseovarius lutimaris]|uniref:Dynamin family protein n=1 Tax=Roseovarius lutimaris TaxID=1005928 RepID=A0A1I5F8C9_9RHOB|nr:dynamin family protein [Roseovarius lutimaris]SFO19561.1 Dynamin family protein [Roseovarius lutimaris]
MTDIDKGPRKPCIALMGEFSAGKSTLANLLIGSDPLPVQVIATQLPPVWISHGDVPAFRVDLEGNQVPIDLDNLAEAPLEETAYIRIFCDEDLLLQCDLLDMPGISDPNMSSEIWQRMISKADGVLWCSHATQAWRQSEAAVWASLPPALYQRSLLLLTRIDKITSDRDRQKVIRRVRTETDGLFLECLPISLLEATTQQDDYDVWLRSGAEDFAKHLVDLLHRLAADTGAGPENDNTTPVSKALRIPGLVAPESAPAPVSAPQETASRITPRRVRISPSDQDQTLHRARATGRLS